MSNPIATALVTYYLLHNSGDTITALSEHDDTPGDFEMYREVSDETIDKMVDSRVLIDEGREYIDEDEDIYFRKLSFTDIEWKFK